MSKADEMFKELVCEKINYSKEIKYKNDIKTFTFFKPAKTFFVKETGKTGKDAWIGITMQELQAINQKCKELGWLDE